MFSSLLLPLFSDILTPPFFPITAVLGPSGAGKSTFLDLLAGRKSPSRGSITFDSSPSFKFQDICSYVEQDDSLLGVLTVEETLSLSAKLS